jgi:hypothetical protein
MTVVLQNVAKSIGMVAAFGAFPAAATTEFELEKECAHTITTTTTTKGGNQAVRKKKNWMEKRGYRDSFGDDDEQGKPDAKEDALIDDLATSEK